MATTNRVTVHGAFPQIYSDISYTARRSGKRVTFSGQVRMWVGNQYGWYIDPWYADLTINGYRVFGKSQMKGWTGQTVIGGRTYTKSFNFSINSDSTSFSARVGYWWYGYMSTSRTMTLRAPAPSAPARPSSVTVSGSNIHPDSTITLNVNSSERKQIQIAFGNRSWMNYNSNTTGRTFRINLKNYTVSNGDRIWFRVRTFRTYNSNKRYYSGWRYDSTHAVAWYSAPGLPNFGGWSGNQEPQERITASFKDNGGGTHGIQGYRYEISIDGKSYVYLGDTSSRSISFIPKAYGASEGSTVRVRARAYTIGRGTKYYSSYRYSSTIRVRYPSVNNITGLKISGDGNLFKDFQISFDKLSLNGSSKLHSYDVYFELGSKKYFFSTGTKNTSFTVSPLKEGASNGDNIKISVRGKISVDGKIITGNYSSIITKQFRPIFPKIKAAEINKFETPRSNPELKLSFSESIGNYEKEFRVSVNGGASVYVSHTEDSGVDKLFLRNTNFLKEGDRVSIIAYLSREGYRNEVFRSDSFTLRYRKDEFIKMSFPDEYTMGKDFIFNSEKVRLKEDSFKDLKARVSFIDKSGTIVKEFNNIDANYLYKDKDIILDKNVSTGQEMKILIEMLGYGNGEMVKYFSEEVILVMYPDKFIYLSNKGTPFEKAKAYLIMDGRTIEVPKDKAHVFINGREVEIK